MRLRIVGHGPKTRYYLKEDLREKEITKEEADALFPNKPLAGCAGLIGWKPLHSEAMAVHPKQIKEAMEFAKKHGVPTNFDAQGRPIFTGRAHRARYMKAHGFYDKSGGYGDAQQDRVKEPDLADELCGDIGAGISPQMIEQMRHEIMTGRRAQ
jgi:hypothetical protein